MKTSLVFHGREINMALEPLWEKKKKSREEIVNSPKNQHSGYEQLFSGPCRLDKLVWVEYSCLCMWLISMSPVPKIVGLCQSHVDLTKNGILQPSAVLMSQRVGCTAKLGAPQWHGNHSCWWKTGRSSFPWSKWSKRVCKYDIFSRLYDCFSRASHEKLSLEENVAKKRQDFVTVSSLVKFLCAQRDAKCWCLV